MNSWSQHSRNSLGIYREVGADKRFTRKSPDPQFQKYIDHTLEHGYVVIEDAFTAAEVDEANAELRRLSDTPQAAGPAGAGGRNKFEGFKTRRIYALLDKSRAFDKFAVHPAVVALNDHFLEPGWLLNAFHSVSIQPGEEPQTLHHDDGSIPLPRPHKPFGTAIMVALDPYTPSNGATVVVPKSHAWGADQPIPGRDQAVPVTMPAGGLVYFLGTLWHGGGRNRSPAERRALTVQYCQPWVRPFENQFVAVDWEKLDQIPPRIVDMMGYQVGAPFLGYADGMDPRKVVARRLRRRKEEEEEEEEEEEQLEEARRRAGKL